MAAYARIYGFLVFCFNEIKENEEFYTEIDDNCFMANGDYAMLEEILEKDL
jgi:hypothetical protein